MFSCCITLAASTYCVNKARPATWLTTPQLQSAGHPSAADGTWCYTSYTVRDVMAFGRCAVCVSLIHGLVTYQLDWESNQNFMSRGWNQHSWNFSGGCTRFPASCRALKFTHFSRSPNTAVLLSYLGQGVKTLRRSQTLVLEPLGIYLFWRGPSLSVLLWTIWFGSYVLWNIWNGCCCLTIVKAWWINWNFAL